MVLVITKEKEAVLTHADLCSRLINFESDVDCLLSTAQCLVADMHKACPALPEQFTNWRAIDELLESARLFCESGQLPDQLHLDRQESLRILAQYAPMGLLTGCVLQNVANPANGHTLLAAQAHAAHALLVGAGMHSHNPAVQFRLMLEQLGIFLPALGSSRFEASTAIPLNCWRLPAYWLSLSLFPEQYPGEILGAAFCEALYGTPLMVLEAQQQAAPNLPALEEKKRRLQDALPHLRDATQTLLKQDADGRVRKCFATGFITSASLLREWEKRCLEDWHLGRQQPQRAMVELVRNKARFARGYHNKLKLAGRVFDDLIVQDAQCFVQELGQSRWVSPGQPEKSLLVTRLLAFGGPMFRIFTEQEETVIRDWIRQLPHSSDAAALATDAVDTDPGNVPLVIVESTVSAPITCVRELYHQLLNLEQYPQIRNSATAFCNSWLARSAQGIHKDDNALPFSVYSHQALRAWFEARAATQVQSYAEHGGDNEKSREDVIDEALQLCPMILIDGAWLRRWSNAGLVETPFGALLYKILSDEIGNGDCALNHPNIYRSLMEDMGIHLPNFRSREFVHFSRFNQTAFEVPAFWLSVSLFPQKYMPETLGLNLAMELSGVGGAYRSARDELRRHGFSTLFVDLHNTIDNVSSGHSAMALEAIELWIDPYLRSNDQQQLSKAWLRIWTGYRALSVPTRSWREWLHPVRYPY
ncbi:iron-containing redox enzyme family protein [Verminephrobacter eiseniae]|uniref:iron-containing redox enzyme family protein n=1 Tax=Verminephrobacter eiseniae TaxID=364317 RepID=UPI00223815A2|nr:iron-containing redox enzyme family protein [Verminephrobacter eiseniae]